MISIPAFHFTDTKTHSVVLPHALAEDLELYRQFYKTTYGAEVKEPELIREIIRCFLDRDNAFKAFRAGHRGAAKKSSTSTKAASSAAADLTPK